MKICQGCDGKKPNHGCAGCNGTGIFNPETRMSRDDYRLRMGTTWVLAVIIIVCALVIAETLFWGWR